MTAVSEMVDGYLWSPDDSVGLIELSAAGDLVAVNRRYCELLDRPREQLLGRSPVEFTHPEDRSATADAIFGAKRRPGADSQLEKRYVRPDGSVRWVRVTKVWRSDARRIVGHVVDISDVVRLRDEARSAARRSRALIEHSVEAILSLSVEGRIEEANPAAEALFGCRMGELAADVIDSVVHPGDTRRVAAELTAATQSPGVAAPVTFRIFEPDGRCIYLTAVADNQLAEPDIAAVIINVHNVTAETEQLHQLARHQQSLVAALGRALEFRDPYTAGHHAAVAELATRIAGHLGLPEQDIEAIALGASVHDLGKIAVPAEILSRPGRLTAAEYEIVKGHCRVGRDILGESSLPAQVLDIVLQHHERLDGSGYPNRVAGSEFTVPARIVAVADVLDAMSSHRPYRAALGLDAARREIRDKSGVLYDPDVVAAALAVTNPRTSRPAAPARSLVPRARGQGVALVGE